MKKLIKRAKGKVIIVLVFFFFIFMCIKQMWPQLFAIHVYFNVIQIFFQQLNVLKNLSTVQQVNDFFMV